LKLSPGDIILEFRVENEPLWILELALGFLPCNGGLRCGDVILEFRAGSGFGFGIWL
jgi:hypothetical protein